MKNTKIYETFKLQDNGPRNFTVFVDGEEVEDYVLSEKQAIALAGKSNFTFFAY